MLPQLDLSTYATQTFWMLLCFCLLWFVMSTFIAPKIADTREQRKRKINEYVKKADALNSQAKAALDKYNETLTQAEKKAEQEIAKEQSELKNYLRNTESQMSADLNKKIAENEFDLAKEKKNTLMQIENIAEDLAFEIVHKLGFSGITRKDIAEVSQRNKTNG
jgi:F-type H+-transporting ATPase subunit b